MAMHAGRRNRATALPGGTAVLVACRSGRVFAYCCSLPALSYTCRIRAMITHAHAAFIGGLEIV